MSGPRLLYIDDDLAFARLAARALERAGYSVEQAATGTEGLGRLQQERFDAVALDHHMPGADGLEVLEMIRALPDPPPVIYVTGSEASQIAVAALKAGAADYVWKDVQGHFRDLLVEAVENALEQAALRRAKEEADREVRDARDRAEILLKEVNHRLANSLSLVASFARLQANTLTDPAAKEALEAMEVRIHAIAGVHRRLYTSENVQVVALDQYLRSLIFDLEQSVRTAHRDHPIKVEAEPVHVSTDRAVSLGIAVTELVTNAYKYAYPDDMNGEIRVRLWIENDQGHLAVEDDGVGVNPTKDHPTSTGLGGRIIKAMAANLGGIEYGEKDKGVTALLRFPISA